MNLRLLRSAAAAAVVLMATSGAWPDVAAPAHDAAASAPLPAGPAAVRPAITNAARCAPGADDYPVESRRRNEQGTAVIRFTIDAEGRLAHSEVVRSSGHPRLDETALRKLSTCGFRAGRTADGQPVGGTFQVQYVWKLE